IVVVHGGGDIVSEYSKRMGVEPQIVVSPSGVRSRYTSREELEVYVMTMAGKINKEMVSRLVARGVRAVGVSGADGPTLLAERKERIIVVDERGRRRVLEGGYTGRIESVDASLLSSLIEKGYLVVVAPIAVSREGVLLNVDGDQAASRIAASLKASKLIALSDVDGLILEGSLVERVRVEELRSLLPRVGPGMNRKLLHVVEALEAGVGEAVIASGLGEKPVSRALERRRCTVITL
ncbi:MAG: [LysW]-aminoadipate/[LysW]-glutamate kinase, partial [Acidilobaceae archaeon]